MWYLFAVLSSLFSSLYVVPRKHTNSPAPVYIFWMGIGFFCGSLLMFMRSLSRWIQETRDIWLLWAVAEWVLRAGGSILFALSIDISWLTKSNQRKNLQWPIAVVFSLIILREYESVQVHRVLLWALCIFLSALCFNACRSSLDVPSSHRWTLYAIAAWTIFGLLTVVNKHVTTHYGIYNQQLIWSASIILSVLIYLSSQQKISTILSVQKKEKLLGIWWWLLYSLASLTMLIAYQTIPASIAFTIIQLNAVWTISMGILLYREIQVRGNRVLILFGYGLAVCAIIVLWL